MINEALPNGITQIRAIYNFRSGSLSNYFKKMFHIYLKTPSVLYIKPKKKDG